MATEHDSTQPQPTPKPKGRFWNRRRFMVAIGGGAVLLSGGVVLSRHRFMAWRIERHFHYLSIESGASLRFVRDYEKAYQRLPYYRRSVSDVYKKFLLSTDFFSNGADENQHVRYIMLYDPYLSPCYNPLKSALDT